MVNGRHDMNGFAVTRRLREARCLVLYLVAGYGQAHAREASRTAGFDHHLGRPVDLGALRVLLAQAPA